MTGAATLAAAAIEDEDVIAENERVANGEANDDLIVINKLTKVYDNGKLAVNNLSLGIPPGQCFGLLGKFSCLMYQFFELFCLTVIFFYLRSFRN
jgi:ABC-type transport system involved in cytochrome bd biosynthesis fused ATPase/permease subunit